MNVDLSMCASSGTTNAWDRIAWSQCGRQVRRLQARIVKVALTENQSVVQTGFAHAGLCNGLSRMKGNFHVRFLGEGAAATLLPYPTRQESRFDKVPWKRIKLQMFSNPGWRYER